MSAYIVDKKHILYLLQAAMSSQITDRHSGLSWVWNVDRENGTYDRATLEKSDNQRAAEVGNMLWLENVKSVSHRYPNESSATLPGPHNLDFVIRPSEIRYLWDSFEPVQVIKACDCFAYQACEHDEWQESEAFAFIHALRSAAWHHLKGYDDAAWGAPATIQEKRAEYRNQLQTA